MSVIVPVYNRQELLPATLDSVCAQTFAEWECVVVDDGSTDRSFQTTERYAAADPRFRALRREGEPRGANRCRNQGFAASTSPYVVFLDSDDLLAPSCLAARVRHMEGRPDLDFAVWLTLLFRERPGDTRTLWNAFTDMPDLARFLGKDPVWHTTGPMWSREAVVRTGGWDESLPSWQDWDFHVRALVAGCRYAKLNIPDHYVRIGARQSAVSAVSTVEREHLESHVALFRRTAALVRAAGMMDAHARERLAASFFWVAGRLSRQGHKRGALSAWLTCFRCGLVGPAQACEGLAYFAVRGQRGETRLKRLIERRWPETVRVAGSSSLHRAEWDGGDPAWHGGATGCGGRPRPGVGFGDRAAASQTGRGGRPGDDHDQ